MKTVNRKSPLNKLSTNICIVLSVVHTTAFSQIKSQFNLSSINPNFAAPIIAVFCLFSFLLYAFIKQKNN